MPLSALPTQVVAPALDRSRNTRRSLSRPPGVNSAVCRVCVRRTRYWTVTRRVDVSASTCDRFDIDQIAEPLLQRALNEELRGRGQLVAVGREDELHQAAAEVGPVDPLARRGEQHLLDQVADVRVVVGLGRAAARVEVKWKIELAHSPLTRVCVENNISGVPVGAQIAWLDCSNTGCPGKHARRADRAIAR